MHLTMHMDYAAQLQLSKPMPAEEAAAGDAATEDGDVQPNPTPTHGAATNRTPAQGQHGAAGGQAMAMQPMTQQPGTHRSMCASSRCTLGTPPCRSWTSAVASNTKDKIHDMTEAKLPVKAVLKQIRTFADDLVRELGLEPVNRNTDVRFYPSERTIASIASMAHKRGQHSHSSCLPVLQS
jgi:hypothetical protein